MSRRSRAAGALLTTALLALGGCGRSSSASPGTPTGATPTASRSPDPNFDQGQKIFITAQGFRPKILVSIWKQPVVWVNQTNESQTVILDHQLVRSGPIAPGGTFGWTSNAPISVTYHSGTMHGAHGAIQVSQPIT
jgi:hypothetical protein